VNVQFINASAYGEVEHVNEMSDISPRYRVRYFDDHLSLLREPQTHHGLIKRAVPANCVMNLSTMTVNTEADCVEARKCSIVKQRNGKRPVGVENNLVA
jgi:hypothetical protein